MAGHNQRRAVAGVVFATRNYKLMIPNRKTRCRKRMGHSAEHSPAAGASVKLVYHLGKSGVAIFKLRLSGILNAVVAARRTPAACH
jgi:hypothetical protein